MRPTSTLYISFIQAVPWALGLAIVEWLLIFFHAALHLGVPTYWATMPITWPANLLLYLIPGPINDTAVEWLLMAVMYFGLFLNSVLLIVVARTIWGWLRSR